MSCIAASWWCVTMTPDDYKQAQKTLGFYGRGKLAGWLDTLGVSESTHKKYTTGAVDKINPVVERLINALLRIQALERGD